MKPCFKNRKLIAWLALGCLEAEQEMLLRQHLERCEGCRSFLDELSTVSATLAAQEPKTGIQATPAFHQRVVAGIKAGRPPAHRQNIYEVLREILLNWRVVVPLAGSIAVALGLLIVFRQPQEVPLPARSSPQIASQPNVKSDLHPTVANYQMVANQSLDKLDQLLTEQGNRKLPPAPIYTASHFAAGSE
jgi:hypothetical protein